MRWFYILVLTIALTPAVSLQADPTQAQAAVDAEQKNVDNSNKKFAEKYDEVKKAEEAFKKDPEGKQGDKTNKEILEEKKKELAEAALDKVNADSALKSAHERLEKLKGDAADDHGSHQNEGGHQSAGNSEGSSAKKKAMAEAMKAAAGKQQEDQKKDEEQKEKKAEQQNQEPTKTAREEKPTQNNSQQEQVATIPEDIKKSLEAPYAKDEESDSGSESQGKKSSSNGYDDLIAANYKLAADKAKETFETYSSLNDKDETSPAADTSGETKKSAKPITVNEYIDGVAAQKNTRSPASAPNRTNTSSNVSPRAMKGATSSRLLNSLK